MPAVSSSREEIAVIYYEREVLKNWLIVRAINRIGRPAYQRGLLAMVAWGSECMVSVVLAMEYLDNLEAARIKLVNRSVAWHRLEYVSLLREYPHNCIRTNFRAPPRLRLTLTCAPASLPCQEVCSAA